MREWTSTWKQPKVTRFMSSGTSQNQISAIGLHGGGHRGDDRVGKSHRVVAEIQSIKGRQSCERSWERPTQKVGRDDQVPECHRAETTIVRP